MPYKKIFFSLGGLFIAILLLTACQSSGPAGSGSKSARHSSAKQQDPGITALAAWQKVQPEVAKWDSQAQLVSIKDKSYASFQRQDGLADVWEFVVDQCRAKNERHHYCNKGKSRTYFYSTTKGGWGPKGVSSRPEEFSSYKTPIDLTKLKIDTDKAVELAKKAKGHANPNEDFIIRTYVTEDGTPYWEIVRQCWRRVSDKDVCNPQDGYTVYVSADDGRILNEKPAN